MYNSYRAYITSSHKYMIAITEYLATRADKQAYKAAILTPPTSRQLVTLSSLPLRPERNDL